MPRLFVKIFIWFWATVVLTGISLVLAFVLLPQHLQSHWHSGIEETTVYLGYATVGTFERGGVAAASKFIHDLSEDTRVNACIFDNTGNALAGEHCADFTGIAARVAKGEPSNIVIRRGVARIAIIIKRPGAGSYIYAAELPTESRNTAAEHSLVAPLRGGIALVVSGLVCYFLTLYLTAPILRLRSVAQRITAGQLSTRADPKMGLRRDELGDLVRDFNSMADKTEHLISSQRQLLYDVSHELRSPLARMNVALDLLRRRVRENPALDRMEIDLRRLNEMIGRLLTVAKLEATSTLEAPVLIDLSKLVSSIVSDANFEAQERGSRVDLVQAADLVVLGEPNLMRSAIENVLRNAVRFTRPGTAVEVVLRTRPAISANEAVITIRDHGAGVPEHELINIFKPFYRVIDLRSRDAEGTGLGLAITKRIVQLHGGSIRAANDPEGGLRVEMIFPGSFK